MARFNQFGPRRQFGQGRPCTAARYARALSLGAVLPPIFGPGYRQALLAFERANDLDPNMIPGPRGGMGVVAFAQKLRDQFRPA